MSGSLPVSLDTDFIGQVPALAEIRDLVDAAMARGESPGHILVTGPAGCGKTTLGGLVANRLGGVPFHDKDATGITDVKEMIAVLCGLDHGDVLGIDEVHGVPARALLLLYRALEYGQFSVAGEPEPVKLPPFTLIAGTTDPDRLKGPLRQRFDLTVELTYYTDSELALIVTRYAESLLYAISAEDANTIAMRSRGTPRIAKRLLRRARDIAQLAGSREVITAAHVATAMERAGLDSMGLTRLDRRVLRAVAVNWAGKAVGLEPLVSFVGNADAKTSVLYLERCGLLEPTKQGKVATPAAYALLGLKWVPMIRGRG